MNDGETLWVFRAKPRLLARLEAFPERLENNVTFRDVFALPEVWVTRESSLPPPSREATELKIKLLFLMHVKRHYREQAVWDLLRFPSVDVSVFDEYWTVERLDGVDVDANEFSRALTAEEAATVVPTGDPGIDGWLSSLRAREDRREPVPS